MDLPPPALLKKEICVSEPTLQRISHWREAVKQIFDRNDPRLLVIAGPCSIHSLDEALEYGRKLKILAEEVSPHCFVVMRAYVEKPRTHMGWKGFLHDPTLNGSDQIERGLYLSRTLFKELAEMGVPAATEFLTPPLAPYFEDLITWGCIGARTSSSQPHRLLASSLPMPLGIKNTVNGSVTCAIHGVMVAKMPQTLVQISEEGRLSHLKTPGNPYAHVVLRGSKERPNYDPETLQEVLGELRKQELPPRLLIDCSHDNCRRQYFKQQEVFEEVLEQIQSGNHHIFGLMLESHLQAGAQTIPSNLADLQPGVSITDPCLDFNETEKLLRKVTQGVMSLTQS